MEEKKYNRRCLWQVFCLVLEKEEEQKDEQEIQDEQNDGGGGEKLRDVQQQAKGNKFLQILASFRQKPSERK